MKHTLEKHKQKHTQFITYITMIISLQVQFMLH